jgi:TDG/mug DNA glycosylase family protein
VLTDLLAPGLRVVIVGTIAARDRAAREHCYAGRGSSFWLLLHAAGLTPRLLAAEEDDRLPAHGIGLTDLVYDESGAPDLAGLVRALHAAAPDAVAFVSKAAASSYARAAGERLPRGYGPPPWPVADRPGFVLPGPSGANNGMPLPLRVALWRDLTDFLEVVGSAPVTGRRSSAARR